MVVAGMSPLNAWHQPLLRLIDTVVGIAVGVACKWIASHVFSRITGKPVR
jgi:ethanolamine transporter EutH